MPLASLPRVPCPGSHSGQQLPGLLSFSGDPRPQAASKQNLGSSPLRSGSDGAGVATSPLVPKGADAPLQTVARWPLGENIPRVTRGHVRGNGTAAPDRGGPGSSPCTTSI